MILYKRECPKCKCTSNFTVEELAELHFCQICYHEHEAIDIHKALEGEE